jgi:hypothetical protein
MTDEEILKQVIGKAIRKGWQSTDWFEIFWRSKPEEYLLEHWYFEIIFSHDFAKAFWGNEPSWDINSGISNEDGHFSEGFDTVITNWEHHLLEVVLEAEPLKYIEQFLSREEDDVIIH